MHLSWTFCRIEFQKADTRISKDTEVERYKMDGKTMKFDHCVIFLMENIEGTTRNGIMKTGRFIQLLTI